MRVQIDKILFTASFPLNLTRQLTILGVLLLFVFRRNHSPGARNFHSHFDKTDVNLLISPRAMIIEVRSAIDDGSANLTPEGI